MDLWTVAAVIAGGAGAVLLAPGAVAALRFTSAGITAGSIASWMMSVTAIASGGGVVAGGLVAILQSIGAAGFSAAATAVVASAGAAIGAAAGCAAELLLSLFK